MDFYATFWALVPPLIAILLALITKEVYSSLFIGILTGALLAAGFSPAGTLDAIISDGFIPAISDNAGIFAFLVILGVIVMLTHKAGAAKAFGRFSSKHIKSKAGALICTTLFGIMIFIDDYFNCLTVGAVMAPVTDSSKVSRVKLAYLIDATAAPICMIAPISSWAAAVSGCVESETMNGFELFVNAIPFNFYSLLTIVFVITISILGFDYGKMRKAEEIAEEGDLGIINVVYDEEEGDVKGAALDVAMNATKVQAGSTSVARVIDMIIPIVVLIISCFGALVYNGGFFDAESEFYSDFVGAFGNTDALVALPWGGLISLIFIIIYFAIRKLVKVKDSMGAIPAGFKMMVPAMLILTFATALKNMTGLLGSREFVAGLMEGAADSLYSFLPAVIFVVGCVLAFATGTSWGTFGILIPIVTAIFSEGDPLMFVGVSACLAGAVCGDHCSPISDTTIMASAGAQCDHVAHVETQLPYSLTVAVLSFIGFIIAGFIPKVYIVLPVMIALTVEVLVVMKLLARRRQA